MNKLIYLLLCLLPAWALGQTCDGNLGDNIFLEGDFGSGVPNILTPNPNIAPSYGYSTNPPPFDGQYVVTNNTGSWSGLFTSWLAIGDNSADPNGYMMVVNADFSPALFYSQTVEDLCENTLYEFSADVINLIRVGVGGHIDPNISFLIDGVVQFDTGNIPSTDQWQTYGFTFETGPGVTEVELSLRNNAPGGIGNDLALDNISFRTCGDSAFILPDTPANICEDGEPLALFTTVVGDIYDTPAVQWQISPNGIDNWTNIPGANDTIYLHTILASGEYFYRYLLANGPANLLNEKCRINSNAKTVIVLPTDFFVERTICEGLSLAVGTSSYTEPGMYVDSLTNNLGCDSIVYTDLTVVTGGNISVELDVTSTACFNVENGQIEVLNVMGGEPPYNFSFEGEDVGFTTLFEGLLGGESYELLVTDQFGCTALESVFVPAPMALTLDIGADLDLILGDNAQIMANTNFTATSYFWSTSSSDVLPCTTAIDCDELQWIPTTSQMIYLTAEDANNCVVTDSVQVNLELLYDIYVPNVFSPNRDGLNDAFTLFGSQPRIVEIESLQVFDRWGKLVFSGTSLTPGNLSQGWNGTVGGKDAAQGVYVYQAQVRYLDGSLRLVEGDVLVTR